jgi:large subunit ribosomal protein L6
MPSRIERTPVVIPVHVKYAVEGPLHTFSNDKGSLSVFVSDDVTVRLEDGSTLFFGGENIALAGTVKAIMRNHINGLTAGFSRKLKLVGVGYRVSIQANNVVLSIGYSNPVHFEIPKGIIITAPTQTEILIEGIDKQQVGQVAAEIRALRPPEPYKGKGIRYEDEVIVLKVVSKK